MALSEVTKNEKISTEELKIPFEEMLECPGYCNYKRKMINIQKPSVILS